MEPFTEQPKTAEQVGREIAEAARPFLVSAIEAFQQPLYDKIDGLESELRSAVEVAYSHGAHEWVRLNYPAQYLALSARKDG